MCRNSAFWEGKASPTEHAYRIGILPRTPAATQKCSSSLLQRKSWRTRGGSSLFVLSASAGDVGWLRLRRTGGLAADPRQRVGMDLVPVDAARPLAKQGPFHLLINKLYSDGWRTQLEAFADSGLLNTLRFPLIAKPLVADGTAKSHKMSLVYHREGLAKLRPPLVLQEFVNHGGPTNGGGRKGGVAAPRADPATAVVARAASTQEHWGGSRRGGRRRLADGGGGRRRRSSSGRASPSPRELAGSWAQRKGLDFASPLLETGFCAAFCVATVDEANGQMHSHFALHCWSQSESTIPLWSSLRMAA